MISMWCAIVFQKAMQTLGDQTGSAGHKVVILGDSRVGKTSILSRQMHGHQPQIQSPTIGCHCSEISVQAKSGKVTLQVWDTAGQEMYRALVPVYLRGAEAAILVYDVTDRESFKSLGHWYDLLVSVLPPTTIVCLVGNKIDLGNEAVVEDQQAKTFAQVHGSQLFKVSAMSGEGLQNLFESLAELVAEKTIGEKGPQSIVLPLNAEKKKKCC
jgi:small GTP-binding protein